MIEAIGRSVISILTCCFNKMLLELVVARIIPIYAGTNSSVVARIGIRGVAAAVSRPRRFTTPRTKQIRASRFSMSCYFDVLDWERSDAEAERYCRAIGYADYVLSVQKTVSIVVEAKRNGIDFIVPEARFEPDPVAFALLEKESPEAGAALRQALGYAAGLGARYIAISNGRQWIIALTYVQSQSIEEREVIVFDSLAKIVDNFRTYWTCF